MTTETIQPHAGMLIESMRDIGYTLPTAMADIIDNSITANATKIDIVAIPDGPSPHVAFIDNGSGMDEATLREAMRLGCNGPNASRAENDLGRFGLGLKTASFSQCRRLTVVTHKDGLTHAMAWDLDLVASINEWVVDIPDQPGHLPYADRIKENGTVVLWESIDRILGDRDADAVQEFDRKLIEARKHLELIFHRYLAGTGNQGLAMTMNGHELDALDPFHVPGKHNATQADPEETRHAGGHELTIRTYTLPHHSKLTKSEYDRIGLSEGHLKNQGFYIYRRKRLIMHGGWQGLARHTDLTKLCRIQIDIPQSLDSVWKIDVRKSSAQLPPAIRSELRKLIERMGVGSRRTYTYRGRTTQISPGWSYWLRKMVGENIHYVINNDHPTLVRFRQQLRPGLQTDFDNLISLANATLPLDSIFSDIGSRPIDVKTPTVERDQLQTAFSPLVRMLMEDNKPEAEINEIVNMIEPFKSNPLITQELLANRETWRQ